LRWEAGFGCALARLDRGSPDPRAARYVTTCFTTFTLWTPARSPDVLAWALSVCL